MKKLHNLEFFFTNYFSFSNDGTTKVDYSSFASSVKAGSKFGPGLSVVGTYSENISGVENKSCYLTRTDDTHYIELKYEKYKNLFFNFYIQERNSNSIYLSYISLYNGTNRDTNNYFKTLFSTKCETGYTNLTIMTSKFAFTSISQSVRLTTCYNSTMCQKISSKANSGDVIMGIIGN